jgi:hypothetical protein
MAADPWTLTNGAAKLIADGTIPIDSGSFKVALFTVWNQITAASVNYAATNEVGTTNTGYATGGAAVDLASATVTTNDVAITQAAVTEWTAGSANLVAKQAVIYLDSGAKPILCFAALDTGHGDVTATNGNKLQIGGTAAAVINITVT